MRGQGLLRGRTLRALAAQPQRPHRGRVEREVGQVDRDAGRDHRRQRARAHGHTRRHRAADLAARRPGICHDRPAFACAKMRSQVMQFGAAPTDADTVAAKP